MSLSFPPLNNANNICHAKVGEIKSRMKSIWVNEYLWQLSFCCFNYKVSLFIYILLIKVSATEIFIIIIIILHLLKQSWIDNIFTWFKNIKA